VGRLVRSLALFLGVSACLPTQNQRQPPIDSDDAGGPPPVVVEGGVEERDAPDVRPHAVLGIEPSHGPAPGGTLTNIRGNGFDVNARVWFGDVEVDPSTVIVRDPQRMQVVTPAGSVGAKDVIVQNGKDTSTRASLTDGFTYDDFYLEPSTGPTAGGTVVTIRTEAELFDDETTIDIDLEPCEIVAIASPTELSCRTPAGTPGAKRVRAHLASGETLDVLDAFTYVVSNDGFRGGLSGNALDGELAVLVLNDETGDAIPGVTVIAGDTIDGALSTTTDGFGTALVSDPALGPTVTVTIAKHCFQPLTFVDVPVDRVTAYLTPVLSPACGDPGQPPAGGGNPGRGAGITGELVWPFDDEQRRADWANVPAPAKEGEVQVAYLFRLSPRATDELSMPSAVSAVTPSDSGEFGATFYYTTSPGNFTLYALAGLEDRSTSPPTFTPYAMGLTRGVTVGPSETKRDVLVRIDVPLDHAVVVNASGPTPTTRGPDRIQAKLAIEVGNEGFVLLPNGKLSSLLPAGDPFSFVGVPPLTGTLTGSRYIATASAVTGAAGGMPRSVVGLFATVTDSEPIGLGSFLEVPALESPASGTAWNGTLLGVERVQGGPAPDLTVIDVESGNGLVTWRIVAPGALATLRVPDLRAVPGDVGLMPGPITLQVSLASIDDFSYGLLRNRQLEPRGWRAYAQDSFFATY
jgi:hypothetical protein